MDDMGLRKEALLISENVFIPDVRKELYNFYLTGDETAMSKKTKEYFENCVGKIEWQAQ